MPEQLSFDFMVPAQDQPGLKSNNLTKGVANMSEHSLLVEIQMVNRGKLKAFADVTFGELTVRGFRVVHEDGNPPWVGFPTISYEQNGKQIYKQILEVPRSLKRQITEAILAEFARYNGDGTGLSDRPQRD